MECEIRALRPEELSESARIIRESFLTVVDEFGFTPENNPTNGAFLQADKLCEEQARGVELFGLFTGARQAGFVALERRDERVVYLEKLAVLPEQRHRGYGRRLLDFARDHVRRAGGAEISIGIIGENTRLKRWYEAYGFVEVSAKRFDHLSFTVCFLTLLV